MKATPKPDAMQRYGADLSARAYSQATVRRLLDDAHAHYEAQVRPLAGLAAQDAGSQALGDARIDAMASAGKVALLCTELAKAHTRIDALERAIKDAAHKLEGAYLTGREGTCYVVAEDLRRAAE